MKKLILLNIALLICSAKVLAQIQDSLIVDTTVVPVIQGDDSLQPVIQLPEKEKPTIKKVSIWKQKRSLFAKEITNDSLLRWQIWPNWGDFYAYRNDALSFRQGSIGRVDAFHINGYTAYEQKVYLDGIQLNNSITGLVNYNFIPHHKVQSVREEYESDLISYINTKDYYITKPLSYLNYDESTNDYRNLEFMLSQNTSPGTNIEISYWDRRDGGFYSNNSIQGSQVFGKVYHYLGDRYQLQGMILRNQFDNSESGGYQVGNPENFSFGEFTSLPKSSSGLSDILRTDIKLGVYERADSNKTERSGFVLYRTTDDFERRIFSDTLSWQTNTWRANAFRKIDLNRFLVSVDTEASITSNSGTSTITESSWTELKSSIWGEFKLSSVLNIKTGTRLNYRNDGYKGNSVYVGVNMKRQHGFNTQVGFSVASNTPFIQSLYWRSKNYTGNSNLSNEKEKALIADVAYLGNNVHLGLSGRFQIMENAVLLSSDSSFVNADTYETVHGSFYAKYLSKRLEIESSVTTEHTLEQDFTDEVGAFSFRDTKLLIRNSIFYKNYAFDRAAFIKLGIRTILSPLLTESQFYNAEIDYWQFNSSEQAIPAYFRMDAELSARVRAIMVVMRWENILDGFGQAGYFEAATFPMPPRRLIVGIRAQFRN